MPEPAPNASITLAVPSLGWLKPLLPWAAVLGLVAYDRFYRRADPAPTPYVPPLASAAKSYRDTLPKAYRDAAAQIRNNTLTDKKSVVAALSAHARPLVQALDATFAPMVDAATGKLTNPSAAADALEQAAKGLEGE